MTLLLATIFVVLVGTFGTFLAFARPENIERPYMVGLLTTITSMVAGWLLWIEWRQGTPDHHGIAVAYAAFALFGFALGRGIDLVMGPRRGSADERQATLGADLAD